MPRKSKSKKGGRRVVVSPPAPVLLAPEPPASVEGRDEGHRGSLTPDQVAKRNRRLTGNANERRRMQQINEGFESLREFVAHPGEEVIKKGELLKRTIAFVGQLVSGNEELSKKGKELEKKLTRKGVNWKQQLAKEKEKASEFPLAAALGLVPAGNNWEETPPSGSGNGGRGGKKKQRRKVAPAPGTFAGLGLDFEEEDDGIGLSASQFSELSVSVSQNQNQEGLAQAGLRAEVAELRDEKESLQAWLKHEQMDKGYLEAQLMGLKQRNKSLLKTEEKRAGSGVDVAAKKGKGSSQSGTLGDLVKAIDIIEGDGQDIDDALECGDEDEDTGDGGQSGLEDSQGSGAWAGAAGEGEVNIASTQDDFDLTVY